VPRPIIKVLLVEDDEEDVFITRKLLWRIEGTAYPLDSVATYEAGLEAILKAEHDICLLDYRLGERNGLEFLRQAVVQNCKVPMILLTGAGNHQVDVEAARAGASDYMIKGQIESRALPRALRHAIERHRMQAETDLIRTHQMQFKDEFLSHVSHELRSPLTAVRQFVTILLDGLPGEMNPEQRQYLEIVLRNVKQLHSMINDLFEVSGVQTGKLKVEPQCTSAPDAIAYAVNTLQGAAVLKGIILSADIEPKLPSVCADPARLRQILIILVDNAIKFTPQNGTVTIQARIFEEDPSSLVLEVSDSGCGIEPDKIGRIFERLFQASDTSAVHTGLGLGLYICKDLVTRQGGKIWAHSAQGEGAVFSATIPIFSLPKMIAPAFSEERQVELPITLVVTELGSQTGWLSDQIRADQCQGMRDLLRGCLHSDLDVLLPRTDSAGPVELFFVVAITDGIGGEAICKRIGKKLGSSEHLRLADLTHSTSYRSLEAFRRESIESKEDFLERVATSIQELMNDEISSRQVKNG